MSTVITSVSNNLSHDIPLHLPGYSTVRPEVVIPASGSLNLLGPLTEDETIAIQPALQSMADAGAITITGTTDPENFWD